MLVSTAAARCYGTTKSGQRCSITSSSGMRDTLGRYVAEPLRKGSPFCMLHTILFCVEPAHIRDAIVCYMDLETDSLDCLSGRIVEIAGALEDSSCVFSTVVNPGPVAYPEQPSVHGIAHDELLEGPCFAEAFRRFSAFLRYASLSALDAEDDSEDDQHGATAMKPDLDVMIVAHNGVKFDFPFLLSECYRARLPLDFFAKLKYVDTLSMVRAVDGQLYGGCMKLQCMLLHLGERGEGTGLRAQCALDDAIVLKDVVSNIVHRLGVSTNCLLSVFSHELDLGASIAHLSSIV